MNEITQALPLKQIVGSAAVIILALVCWSANTHFYRKYLKQADGISQPDSPKMRTARTIFSVIRYTVLIFALLTLLQINGINISSILAGLGIASVVFGLAIQEPLRDIIAGIQIISDRFYKVGDAVSYNGTEGVVVFFDLRCTKIQIPETRSILTVSNRNISEITQVSGTVIIDVPLPYTLSASDSKKAMAKISARIAACEGISGCGVHGIEEFADSSVNWRISFECDPKERPLKKKEAAMIIYETLEEEGISIPFNQLDVHHISES